MDATVLATVLGAVAAGAGSLLVPTLLALFRRDPPSESAEAPTSL